jgi:hypothetical protein
MSSTTGVSGIFGKERGDVIAIPGLQQHTHSAAENAVLFRVSDEPVMSRLGFLRSAAERQHHGTGHSSDSGAIGRLMFCAKHLWLNRDLGSS